METNQEVVKFNNTEIVCVVENSKVYVAIRPIAESIGLNPGKATQGIKNDSILNSVSTLRGIHDASNRIQNMLCLPIEYMHGWLFSIDDKKVKAEVRENLLKYKKDCYKILFDHFFGHKQKVMMFRENLISERFEKAQSYSKIGRELRALNNQIFETDLNQLPILFSNENR